MPDPARTLTLAAARLGRAAERVASPLRVGVDLGTASCVLAVLDCGDEPVWVEDQPSGALADGVVVDFAAATRTVAGLKERAEAALAVTLPAAATGYPPRIARADARACRYVCEAAGFDGVVLVDEITAAQRTLALDDGVLIDVGGGSTGVGVFRGGRLQYLDDRPGGGHHLDLVLAGALGAGVEEARRRKHEQPDECLSVLVPGFERIAESVRVMTRDAPELSLHVAGGALMIPGAEDVLAKYLGRAVVTYPHPLLATPVGIARSAA
jgi:ethanolamine utilization protein EutJ